MSEADTNVRERFAQPKPVDDLRVTFPANVEDLMPGYEDIPDDFKGGANPYVKWQRRWFHHGLSKFPDVREEVSKARVARHLAVIQKSFEPKHEHKEAAVAFLASLWIDESELGKQE